MGFFSGIIGSKKTTVPATGFYAMPKEYQDMYKNILANAKNTLPNITPDMVVPSPLSSAEQQAIGNINQGFTPNQEQLTSDINMQMNPFDQSVIDTINREAKGANSVLQTNLAGAGQMGSNRQLLGANDIDLTRLNQIGTFKQSQYNQALQNALTNLVANRRADAASQMATGDFLRGFEAEKKQAPINAIRTQQGILAGFPSQYGNFGTPQRTIKEGGGLQGILNAASQVASIVSGFGGGASGAGGGSSFYPSSSYNTYAATQGLPWSDIRLKTDIKPLGKENGHNVYEFRYRGFPQKYIGVMAQEVEKTHPEAVKQIGEYKAVDYSKIGVEFRGVA